MSYFMKTLHLALTHGGKFAFAAPQIVILLYQNILRMGMPRQRSLARLTNFPPKALTVTQGQINAVDFLYSTAEWRTSQTHNVCTHQIRKFVLLMYSIYFLQYIVNLRSAISNLTSLVYTMKAHRNGKLTYSRR